LIRPEIFLNSLEYSVLGRQLSRSLGLLSDFFDHLLSVGDNFLDLGGEFFRLGFGFLGDFLLDKVGFGFDLFDVGFGLLSDLLDLRHRSLISDDNLLHGFLQRFHPLLGLLFSALLG